jgi:regulatory protein
MEDGNSFPLGRKESRHLELSEGKELTEDQIQWIYEELVFPRGRNYLIYLLAARDYTEKEVKDKLRKAHYPEEMIERILNYGREKHYLDDFRYAQDYISSRKSSKSIRLLKYQLSMKGIPDSVLSKLEVDNDAEELLPLIERYWEKKKGNSYEKSAKTYQYFVRKGYNSSLVKELIRQVSTGYEE